MNNLFLFLYFKIVDHIFPSFRFSFFPVTHFFKQPLGLSSPLFVYEAPFQDLKVTCCGNAPDVKLVAANFRRTMNPPVSFQIFLGVFEIQVMVPVPTQPAQIDYSWFHSVAALARELLEVQDNVISFSG